MRFLLVHFFRIENSNENNPDHMQRSVMLNALASALQPPWNVKAHLVCASQWLAEPTVPPRDSPRLSASQTSCSQSVGMTRRLLSAIITCLDSWKAQNHFPRGQTPFSICPKRDYRQVALADFSKTLKIKNLSALGKQ